MLTLVVGQARCYNTEPALNKVGPTEEPTMSAQNLPVLAHPKFPQVFVSATERFVSRLEARPQLGQCQRLDPFAEDVSRCHRQAIITNRYDGQEYCAACFAEVWHE